MYTPPFIVAHCIIHSGNRSGKPHPSRMIKAVGWRLGRSAHGARIKALWQLRSILPTMSRMGVDKTALLDGLNRHPGICLMSLMFKNC